MLSAIQWIRKGRTYFDERRVQTKQVRFQFLVLLSENEVIQKFQNGIF